MRQVKLGTLTAHVTGGTDGSGGGTGPLVVLLHGYGAPGTDLVPLGRQLAIPPDVRVVFPEAPLEVGFGGRAWWPLDMSRLQERFSPQTVEKVIAEVPRGIDSARAALLDLLASLERDFGAAPEQTVIGGFSQGAMLSTDTVLRTSRPFGGLAILSGSLISHDEWLPLLPARRGLPVLQSHGRADPVLPFELAERLHRELEAAGLSVEFIPFHGGHGIASEVLAALSRLIRALPSTNRA